MSDEPRQPIADKLPRVGRARDLDVRFLELFADLITNQQALKLALDEAAQSPELFVDVYKRLSPIIQKREDALKARFEEIIRFLQRAD